MVRFPFFFHSALIQGFKNTKGLRLILVFFWFPVSFSPFQLSAPLACGEEARLLHQRAMLRALPPSLELSSMQFRVSGRK